MHRGTAKLCKHPPHSCQHRGRSCSPSQGYSPLEIQMQFQSHCPLGHASSISPRDRPVLGGGCGTAATPQRAEAPAGSAETRAPRFPPQTPAEHMQGERLEMLMKWPSLAAKQRESHSAAKSQQHGGARAAQIGGYLTISRQGKLLSSFFPKSW